MENPLWSTIPRQYEVKSIVHEHSDHQKLSRIVSGSTIKEISSEYVYSMYFASSDLIEIQDKIDSSYLKTKYRVRYYKSKKSEVTSNCYFEIKKKYGEQRQKMRRDIKTTSENVENKKFYTNARFYTEIATPFLFLRPLLLISYKRERFFDIESSVKINVDSEITLETVNPIFLSSSGKLELPNKVIELKSEKKASALQILGRSGLQQSNFSKLVYLFQLIKFKRNGKNNEFYNELLSSDY